MLRTKDLREGNLLPILVDFGLAEYIKEPAFLIRKCGTPGYTAPEILTLKNGDKTVDYD